MSMTSVNAGGYVLHGSSEDQIRDNQLQGAQIRLILNTEKDNIQKAWNAIAPILNASGLYLSAGVLDYADGADLSEVDGYYDNEAIYINLNKMAMALDGEEAVKDLVLSMYAAMQKAGVKFEQTSDYYEDDHSFDSENGIYLPYTFSGEEQNKCHDVKISYNDLHNHGIPLSSILAYHNQPVAEREADIAEIEADINAGFAFFAGDDANVQADIVEMTDTYEQLRVNINDWSHWVGYSNDDTNADLKAMYVKLMKQALPAIEANLAEGDKIGQRHLATFKQRLEAIGDNLSTQDVDAAHDALKAIRARHDSLVLSIRNYIATNENPFGGRLEGDDAEDTLTKWLTISPSNVRAILLNVRELKAQQAELAKLVAERKPAVDAVVEKIAEMTVELGAVVDVATDDKNHAKKLQAAKNAGLELNRAVNQLMSDVETASENATAEEQHLLHMVVDYTLKLLSNPKDKALQAEYRNLAAEVKGNPSFGAQVAKGMLAVTGAAIALAGALALAAAAAPVAIAATVIGGGSVASLLSAYGFHKGQRCGISQDVVNVARSVEGANKNPVPSVEETQTEEPTAAPSA